jgi:long-chain acyl-CoA synthetase
MIKWAMGVAEKYKDTSNTGFLFGFKLFWARILVLNAWRKKLGGKIRYIGVGAAALQPKIGRSFSAAGIATLVGYGLTEASPFVTVNRPGPGMNKHGTVGLAIPGVEVKIDSPDDDGIGEIQVRGPNIMSGYYKHPELTAEVLTSEGWLRTGDIGRLTDKHYLTITDRKKDIFKTSSGKYIAPQPLENHFASSSFIIQCLVIGFNRPYVTALLVPNFSLLKVWCGEEGIHWTSPQFMVHNIKVIERIQSEVDDLNESLENHKKMREFVLSEEEWTAESNYLTVSLKLIRDRIEEKYKKEIEALYPS